MPSHSATEPNPPNQLEHVKPLVVKNKSALINSLAILIQLFWLLTLNFMLQLWRDKYKDKNIIFPGLKARQTQLSFSFLYVLLSTIGCSLRVVH